MTAHALHPCASHEPSRTRGLDDRLETVVSTTSIGSAMSLRSTTSYRVGDLTIAYSQRNLPRVITGDKVGVVTYRYDAGGGRASKRGRDVDVTYFGLYELERRGMQLYERLSIPTPAGVVAQLERTGADGQTASRLRWLLSERQGSTETSWVEGEEPEHHRYDAYGGVLSDAGSVTGARPSETVSHGYTGHEHEDELGLVNMGGRIYSPRLRRFLTADPIVAVPFGQGLNAYSYVRGNPLNAVDPSGWQERPSEGTPGSPDFPHQLPEIVIVGRTYSAGGSSSGDGPANERPSSGAAGQAPAQAIDTERAGPPRGEGGGAPNAYGFSPDAMATAAQQVQPALDGADQFARGVTYVGGAALGAFAATEVAAGGVVQVAVAAEETSVGISQGIHVATQVLDGILADAMGGISANTVPALVGAAGVGVRMAGEAGDDISRAASRATAAGASAEAGVPALRQQYVDAVTGLRSRIPGMREAGMTSEQIARALHAERRALGERFKALTPSDRLEQIYERNLSRYGDRLGPTVEWLRNAGRSWEDIIESATRTGGRDLGF